MYIIEQHAYVVKLIFLNRKRNPLFCYEYICIALLHPVKLFTSRYALDIVMYLLLTYE